VWGAQRPWAHAVVPRAQRARGADVTVAIANSVRQALQGVAEQGARSRLCFSARIALAGG